MKEARLLGQEDRMVDTVKAWMVVGIPQGIHSAQPVFLCGLQSQFSDVKYPLTKKAADMFAAKLNEHGRGIILRYVVVEFTGKVKR